MTDDIRRFGFLLRQQPICTQSTVKVVLGPDRHRELRAKYKLELGLDLLADRCSNVFNCKSLDNGCIGRPFPIDDEIFQALKGLNVEVSKGIFKGRDVYLAKATVLCSACPFNGQCEVSCASQDSYLNRNVKPESNPPDNKIVSYDDFEKGMYGRALTPEDVAHCEYGSWASETLPLNCLTPKQIQVIEMTLYQGLEQAQIAEEIGTSKQDVSQTIKLAISRLSEFGKARKAISQSRTVPQRVVDYYINNLTHHQIATKEGKDRSVITKSISKWYNRNVP